MRFRRLIAALCVLAAAGAVVAAAWRRALPAYAYRGCTPQQVEVFQLLDDFYPYDVSGCPFVDVTVGGVLWLGDPVPREFPLSNIHRPGFLLHETRATLDVRFLDGERALLSRSGAGMPPWQRVGCAPASLREHGLRLAADAAHPTRSYRPEVHAPLTVATTSLLAARELARRGDLQDLDDVWRTLPDSLRARDRLLATSRGSPFVEDLASRLALDFGDRTLAWKALLERHERLLALVPHDEAPSEVEERRDQLRTMSKRSSVLEWPLAVWRVDPVEELRAAERSNEGGRWGIHDVPSWCPEAHDHFATIAARGLDVVPALIEALTDGSLTRSRYYHNNGKGRMGVYVRMVGDLAEDALKEIFGGPAYIVTGNLWHHMRAEDWRAWYEETSRTGLRLYLRAKMRDTKWADDAAASYLRCWPRDVEAVLDAAAELPLTERLKLLRIAAEARSCMGDARARTIELLLATAREGGIAECAEAAQLLLLLGDDGGVYLLRGRGLRGEELNASAWFVMLASGLPEICRDVASRLDTAAVRRGVASVAWVATREELMRRVAPAHRAEIEGLLRRCWCRLLADTSSFREPMYVHFSVVHSDEDVALPRASNADLAACALNAWWPDEYPFDPACTPTLRRRQIDAMLRALGHTVPPAPEREPGRTPDEFGTIRFGAGTESLPAELKQRLRTLEHTAFDVQRIRAAIEHVATSCQAAVLLHCERTGGGDGWSSICESDGTRETHQVDVHVTIGGRQHEWYAGMPDPAGSAGAVEITFVAR